jgi:hypothetical protein
MYVHRESNRSREPGEIYPRFEIWGNTVADYTRCSDPVHLLPAPGSETTEPTYLTHVPTHTISQWAEIVLRIIPVLDANQAAAEIRFH